MTRDCTEGVLSDCVEIWCVKPTPSYFADGDGIWLAPIEMMDRGTARVAVWSVTQAMKEARTVPEDVHECIRVGR